MRRVRGGNLLTGLRHWLVRWGDGPRPTVKGWRIEGPFDSSYSLAIENRELALALAELGENVTLESRDGPGPFAPNPGFLAANPRIAAMWKAGKNGQSRGVVLRNTYPPFVADMKGELRGLACYAWEESGFPPEYVDAFNAHLDVVTVLSRFVAKVLRDNGVHVPIRVVGCGIDQVARLEAAPQAISARQRFGLGDEFCFLHISTCLPRKAMDVLLAAWVRAFTRDDNVVLVIKATANQHHRIEDDVAALATVYPRHARIVLINEHLPDTDIYALYQHADVVVCASRGEGFGLPLAEAMALGKPVIATGYGGQMDFCTPENAWLCDWDFAYAHTHLSTTGSIWAEPRLFSLIECLRRAAGASPLERAQMGEHGRATVRGNFAWTHVAKRLQAGVAEVEAARRAKPRLLRLGWVSPWNVRCAIAERSRALVRNIPEQHLVVLANRNSRPLEPDQAFVRRCWEINKAHSADDLCRTIVEAEVDALVVQFDFTLLPVPSLAHLIDRIAGHGTAIYVFLHRTTKEGVGGRSLSDASASLQRARRLLVHSVHDLNWLKALGIVDNVTLFPLPPAGEGNACRSWDRLSQRLYSLIRGEFADDLTRGAAARATPASA